MIPFYDHFLLCQGTIPVVLKFGYQLDSLMMPLKNQDTQPMCRHVESESLGNEIGYYFF